MSRFTRRTVLKFSAAAAASPLLSRFAVAQESMTGSHGMTVIGDLKYPADFPHFDYVNPIAPRAGKIVTQTPTRALNQNFSTFDTLHIYVLRGNGPAGMPLTFASLMEASMDEPGSVYGYVAREVEISDDRKTLRFFLREEAVFHDGTPITAEDVAFSLQVLKDKGHPNISTPLSNIAEIVVEDERTLLVRLAPESGLSIPVSVASAPIFSTAWWEGKDFEASYSEAPLGSGPYKLHSYSYGNWIEFERVTDYWADNLPVIVGRFNFARLRYEYYRDRTASLEAFKKGIITFREEFTSRAWARDYDFPAFRDGRVVREEVPDGSPSGAQGWFLNMRRSKFANPKVREALTYAFDFEWTNKNIMFDSYERTHSFFENSPLKAEGMPGPDELALLDPWRGKIPDSVFGEAIVPPVSDGSGRDRALLQKASNLLAEGGCERTASGLLAPDGSPFTIEFLDDDPSFEPHHMAYIAGLKLLGIEATYRVVDAAQYNDRTNTYDFDATVSRFSAPLYPDTFIRQYFSSASAAQNGTFNLSGVSDPAVDALMEHLIQTKEWETFVTAGKALDRLLRAIHFWVPQWSKGTHWFAYWDMFDRPAKKPDYDRAVVDTWWYDPEKATRIGKAD